MKEVFSPGIGSAYFNFVGVIREASAGKAKNEILAFQFEASEEEIDRNLSLIQKHRLHPQFIELYK